MPTYGKDNFKESNVNYLNKDFASLKTSLMNYAKSYFPDTYRDFNEASPGMMLLEMNAYVGDVLSFYIDQQYREILLPLAEERKNIISMAKMFGYKVKPIVPAYVDLTFTSDVAAESNDTSKINYATAGVFDIGIEIPSISNSNILFSTLDQIDFSISDGGDVGSPIKTNSDNGLAEHYTLSRTVRAVSATEKTLSFKINSPEKFKTITIPDINVIDIISCVDSNGNDWYEVDFLAQDKVPVAIHYTNDENRNSAYQDLQTQEIHNLAVPYSLQYIKTAKRFTRETNIDNTTSLVFGNGVLKNGEIIEGGFLELEQVGIIVPGQSNNLNSAINPLLGDEYSTLGEAPNQTTLTITYRIGGGISSNVNSGELSTLPSISPPPIGGSLTAELLTVTNKKPARGGKNEEDTIEIKEKAKAFFTTQNRCVTKEDYEARVMNIPAKFGNIAKVYVTRNVDGDVNTELVSALSNFTGYATDITERAFSTILMANMLINNNSEELGTLEDLRFKIGVLESRIRMGSSDVPGGNGLQDRIDNVSGLMTDASFNLSSINIYLLGYNNSKQLVGNSHTGTTITDDNLPLTLLSNIKKYLENFKLMTDSVNLKDGYIINFGVFFDIIAEDYANKQEVKLKCIQKIKDYFRVEKMQFNQPIYKSQLEYELMGVEGVRSIGHVTIDQESDYNGDSETLPNPTYTYSFTQDTGIDINGDGNTDSGYIVASGGTTGYGYKYHFQNALSDDGTIILPPLTSSPTVFELKNPNTNIQGRVR